MAIPDEIKALKPTDFGAVEIRSISGHFYVYEISSKWDPEKKKAVKVTGKTVGKNSPEDIIAIGRNIYKVREHYHSAENRLSEISKAAMDLLNELGIKLL